MRLSVQNVPPDSTYWDLLPRLADEGGRLLIDTLRKMQAGTVSLLFFPPFSYTADRSCKACMGVILDV